MALELLRRSLLTSAPVMFEQKITSDSKAECGFIIFEPHPEDPRPIVEKICQPKKLNPLSLLPPDVDKTYLQFPFLEDSHTFRFLNSKKSKVLLIMRGMPGSGKSTIVRLIKSSFDLENLVICSADHFFTHPDGSYHFDEKLISVAHGTCQQKAKEACENNIPVVVIDNTNVRRWEMKFYLNLSATYGYVTVFVQPRTPWSMNPAELVARTVHNVPLEALEKKVKSFEDVIPLYYGWFCDENKSARLLDLSSQLLRECVVAFPEFRQDLLMAAGVRWQDIDEETACGIIRKYFTRSSKSNSLLHCTAMFCARGKVSGSSNYHQREDVKAAYCRMFCILVPGLVFTRKTMGARVTLGADAATLFCKPEERDWGSPSKASGSSPSTSPNMSKASSSPSASPNSKKGKKAAVKAEKRAKRKSKKWSGRQDWECDENDDNEGVEKESRPAGDEELDLSENSLSGSLLSKLVLDAITSKTASTSKDCDDKGATSSFSPENSPSLSELFPSVLFEGQTRSAHLTLRTAPGVESRETNFDVLHTCDLEQELVRCSKPFNLVPVSHGQACYHGDGVCCVYFNEPLKLRTIFSGSY